MSGRFSNLTGMPRAKKFRIFSWNSQALLHNDIKHRRKIKLNFLHNLSKTADVIMVQETHGIEGEAHRQLQLIDHNFMIFHSPGATHDAGGLITLLHRDIIKGGSPPIVTEIEQGRIHVVTVTHNTDVIHYINVHNCNISSIGLQKIRTFMSTHASFTSALGGAQTMWVGGDWNFLVNNESPRKVSGNTSTSREAPRQQQAHTWSSILSTCTEFAAPHAHTHYSSDEGTFTRIDRIYTNMPRWIIPIVCPTTHIISSPDILHAQHISDHSPIGVELGSGRSKPKNTQTISPAVFKHKFFKQYYEPLIHAAQLHTYSNAVSRTLMQKEVLREAAKKALQAIRDTPEECAKLEFEALTYSTIARAAWNKHTKVLRRLLAQHTHMQSYISVVDDHIVWTDRDGFAQAHQQAKANAIKQKQTDFENGTYQEHTIVVRNQASLHRAAKLWSPLESRVTLTAVRTEAGIITDAPGKAKALADGWAPTFAQVIPVDEVAAQAYLELHAVPLEWSSCSPPTSAQFELILAKMPHSAPGPDGLPYAAWQAGGRASAVTLHKLLVHILDGGHVDKSFNESLTVFLPKGAEETDAPGHIVRNVADTRILSFKNTDNKLICSSMNYISKPVLSHGISYLQRGFIPGRQLICNVLDLDTYSHIHAMMSNLASLPILVFFDFAAAFPSISHTWLFMTLEAMKFPAGFINLVKTMYTDNHAMYSDGTAYISMFTIMSGILQGCPLSGLLFAVCIYPFLKHIEKVTRETTT